MKRTILFWILSIIFSVSILSAEVWEVGVPSLMMDSFGAREMALGDTFVGIADDINTISVNPAGLNTLNSAEVSLMYMSYPLDMSFMYAAGGFPLPGSLGYAAASLTLFSVGAFDEIDLVGNETGKSLSASDFLINVGYANNLFGINAGINMKFVSSKLVEESSSAFAFDIGFLYQTDMAGFGGNKLKDNLGIGLSIQNLGTSVNYGNEDTILPRNIRIGAGYKAYKDKQHDISGGFDINLPNDSGMIPSIGIEYSYIEMIFARIGYKFSGREADHFSFGVGGKYDISGKLASFDYALIPLSDLGIMHSFSLSLSFGSAPGKKEEVKADVEKDKPQIEKSTTPAIEEDTAATEEDAATMEEDTAPATEEDTAATEEDKTKVEEDTTPAE